MTDEKFFETLCQRTKVGGVAGFSAKDLRLSKEAFHELVSGWIERAHGLPFEIVDVAQDHQSSGHIEHVMVRRWD